MSYCEFHPDRLSVGRCSKCGNQMCSDCMNDAGMENLCPSCRGITFQQSQHDVWATDPSPWDIDAVMDGTTVNLLRFGLAGTLLSIFGFIIMTILVPFIMMSGNPTDFIVVLALFQSILGSTTGILLAMGYKGIYRKYRTSISRFTPIFVLASGLLPLVYVGIGLFNYEAALYLQYVMIGFGIFASIIIGFTFLSIREMSTSPQLTFLLAILTLVGSLSVFVSYGVAFLPLAIFMILSSLSLANTLAGFLLVYFFYMEQKQDVKREIATW